LKRFYFVTILLIVLAFLATGCTKIDKGYEGAKINTLGSDQGQIQTLDTGWHFYNPFKYDIVVNPTFVQEYVWTKNIEEGSPVDESITFQSSNSLAFNADVGVSIALVPGKSGILYEKYHKTIGELINSNFRNSIRDSFNRVASSRNEEGIYGSGKTAFIEEVEANVRDFWKDYFEVRKIYLIGKLDPPTQIREAISKKIEATQMAERRRNEVEQSKAEADKKIEEARGFAESERIAADARAYKILAEANAEAKKIKMLNEQLAKSPNYVEFVKASRWDGVLPKFVGGKDPIPFLNVE
jgi:regulator of protease activity HflC (stomatin/prohibitin superfamily)